MSYEDILYEALNSKTQEEVAFFIDNFLGPKDVSEMFLTEYFVNVLHKYGLHENGEKNVIVDSLVAKFGDDINFGDILLKLIDEYKTSLADSVS